MSLKHFIALLLLMVGIHAPREAMGQPTLAWAYGTGDAGVDNGNAIATDAQGNVYTTGYFADTVDFDPGPGVFMLNSLGNAVFVQKLDSAGQFLWAVKLGGASNGWSVGRDILVDVSGNVIVYGDFFGVTDFDPGAGTFNMTNTGAMSSPFIWKLRPNGSLVWAKMFAGVNTGNSVVGRMALDGGGGLYFSGYFFNSVDFDPGPGAYVLTAGTNATWGFVARLDSAGNIGWARKYGSPTANTVLTVNSVAVDADRNTLIAGRFQGTVDFDHGPGVIQRSSNGGAEDIFLQKADSLGNVLWVKTYGGSSSDIANACVFDPTGSVYLGGHYSNLIVFGGVSAPPSAGGYDAFVLKLDAAGNEQWARTINCASQDNVLRLALDAAANVFVCGYYSGTFDFDPGPGTFSQTPNTQDAFIWELDGGGGFKWAGSLGGPNLEYALGLAISPFNAILVTGLYSLTIDVDPTPGTLNMTACCGSQDIYQLSLRRCIPKRTTITASPCSPYTLNSQTYTTPGTYLQELTSSTGCDSVITLHLLTTGAPAQPATISGPNSVCAGTTNTYTVTPVAGATSYTWVVPGGWTGTSTTNSITVTVNSSSGSISVRSNNGCGSSNFTTVGITVNLPPPSPTSLAFGAPLCINSNEVFSVNTVPGALGYTWTLPPGWTGFSNTEVINVFTGSNGGMLTVTANNACGSSAPPFTAYITLLEPATQPGAISGPVTVCQGSTHTYSVAPAQGATSYLWTLPSGWSGSSTTNSIVATANGGSGNVTVTALSPCGNSAPQTLFVTVQTVPGQPGTITGPTTVCAGTSYTYSVGSVSGATSYTWTLPGGWSGSSTTNTIQVVAGTNGGTISVTANSSCGASPARTLAVAVMQVPSQPGPIAGLDTVCAGSTNTYAIFPVPGASSYVWTLPSGWTGSSGSNAISAIAGSNGGTVSVVASNSCGASAPQVIQVLVMNVPAQPNPLTGPASICEGSVNGYSTNAVSGANSYTWTLPPGWTGSSTTSSVVATANNLGGTISVSASNACGVSQPQSLNVVVTPYPTALFGSSSLQLLVNFMDMSTGSPTSWLWDFGDGGTSVVTNPVHTYAAAGTYTVCLTVSTNGCSDTLCQPVAVTAVGLVPQPEWQVSVSPNPSAGYCNLETDQALRLSVIDAQGRQVLQDSYEVGRHLLDLTGLADGVYLLHLEGDFQRKGVRLVKIGQ